MRNLLDDARTDAAKLENEAREKMKLEMQLQQLQQQLAMRTSIGAVFVCAPSVSVATLSAASTTVTVIETDNTDDVVTQLVSGTGNVGIDSAIQAPVDVNVNQSIGLTGYPPADRMYTISVPANKIIACRQVNATTYITNVVGLVTYTQIKPAAIAASSSITRVQPQDTGITRLPQATNISAAAAQPPPSSRFGSNAVVLDEQS